MDRLKKTLLWVSVPLLIGYIIICSFLYFIQENIIFQPHKLAIDYQYQFDNSFDEINIPTKDGQSLNALHFYADSAKGLVLFFHGNGGALDSWGNVNEIYTNLNYDVLLVDYKGYGKNKGEYKSQAELFGDMQAVYDYSAKNYDESKIVLVGYSLGTGIASYLATNNNPQQLVLLAPYYSIKDIMRKTYPFIPTFILKYSLNTFEYIEGINSPVTIFQGDDDNPNFLESSLSLKPLLNSKSRYILLENQGHNGIHNNLDFQKELGSLLK